jgi:hypothetical protein
VDHRRAAAYLALGACGTFSLINNIAATAPNGVRVTGAIAVSIGLPLAIHLWGAIRPDDPWRRWIRNIVMFGIAAIAAGASAKHAYDLYTHNGEHPAVALGIPVITELLVAFAVLALRKPPPVVQTVRRGRNVVSAANRAAKPVGAGTPKDSAAPAPTRQLPPRPPHLEHVQRVPRNVKVGDITDPAQLELRRWEEREWKKLGPATRNGHTAEVTA